MPIWLNGQLLPAEAVRIDPADRGLLLGDGVFETMAAQGGSVPELARHYARLDTGASLLRIPLPLTLGQLAGAIHELLRAEDLADAALRLTLTRGPGPRGLLPPPAAAPTLLLTAAPPPPDGPLRLITSSILRDETSPLCAIKSLNYLPNLLARMEAADRGADDALLLNHAGRVAETSAANIFIRLDGEWVTPPVSEGALPGIRRACLLDAGKLRESRVTLRELYRAEAVCAGNALSLRTVVTIDGQPLPQPCSYP